MFWPPDTQKKIKLERFVAKHTMTPNIFEGDFDLRLTALV